MYELGDVDAPALLYLHGGPGMGCHNFVQWQGQTLARGVRLVTFDQRGFHQSDALGPDEPLSEDIIVEDCEALREALGIASWFVIGHSYGGRLATRYAARYPASVRGVIFENPSWDVASTRRFRLPVVATLFERHGRPEEAQACRDDAASTELFADDPMRTELLGRLGPLGERWFLHPDSDRGLLDHELVERLHDEADDRAAELLFQSPLLLENLTALLAGLTVPSRLVLGEADLVTAPDQVAIFEAAFGADRVVRVAGAGHVIQGEQPAVYAELVLDLVDAMAQQR
ncbi:alpha/beta hydrolase [Catenulispora yoronensis]|uniref:alpha/beta fold hydrolase n=1 Tax=Catenulispora yoronensis TaxID=450799 RepID=UPI0031E0F6E6